MISDRTASSLVAVLLSIPPIVLVAAVVHHVLPAPPRVPAVVGANDQRGDAFQSRPKAPHPDEWDRFRRQVSAVDVKR